jgi:hypothetical protein
MCTHAILDNSSSEEGVLYQNDVNYGLIGNSTDTYDTIIAKYGDAYLLYELETPTETDISETELNAYRQLMTNKGTTTILSEADMSVTYYPDNDCAQSVGNVHSEMRSMMNTLTQAIISIGGAE